ncbi:hypothetical protein [Nannocystis punicea]|uniref:Uncharacterized protein n=1 Tax=Nannocystis punicea TaxID=2995304 RepID=A0ABY7H8A8_9BACT|nr:hypothetical protein [Nannocystis poenicansa]WAS95229.1 hypothetical protein O0S08_03630 [Nannocystis poenicansa]
MKHCIVMTATLMTLLSSARAVAGPATLTLHNKTNRAEVNCAIVRWDEGSNFWVTHHWYLIELGESRTFSNVEYYRCEEVGGSGVWDGDGSFSACVTRGDNYVNPLYNSTSVDDCNEAGGTMTSFGYVEGPTRNVHLTP